jgi:hypothetical protein
MKNTKLQQLEESFASLLKDSEAAIEKLKKAKADMGETETEDESEGPDTEELMNMCYSMFRNLADRIYYLGEDFYKYAGEHSKGHLPPVKTVTGMQKALKALGMEGDYEINKPWISVASSRGTNIVAEFKK